MAGNQSQLSLAAATLTFPCSQSHLCKQGRSISAGTHTFQMVIKTRSCVRQITVGCSGNTVWNLQKKNGGPFTILLFNHALPWRPAHGSGVA